MAKGHERGGESLVFASPEDAQGFRERVVRRQDRAGDERDAERGAVADVLAEEFAAHGSGVGGLQVPWEHTPEEHTEAQKLVDVAFAQDLGVAIAQAEKGPHFPRVLDLLHDSLTGQLYELLVREKMNKERLGRGHYIMIALAGILVLVAALLILASV